MDASAPKKPNLIIKGKVPAVQKVMYPNFICDQRPLKSEPFWVWLAVGRDRLDFLYDTAYPEESLLEKIILNNIISDACKGDHFL